MIELLNSLISNNSRVLLLGFGKEGRSSYIFLRKHFPKLLIGIADVNSRIAKETTLINDDRLELFLGDDYLSTLQHFDIIIKSPGVNIGNVNNEVLDKITSQTDLFLQCYAPQVVGVTGTKGKSTTVSLIKHFLEVAGKKVLLIGNIGVPAFDMIKSIENDTVIVYELSAHQLEYLRRSPHIAVLLNVFPEHLDYFSSYGDYRNAKFNIYKFQNKNDCLIIHESLWKDQDFPESTGPGGVEKENNKNRIIEFSDDETMFESQNSPLSGDHNIININAALLVANQLGVDTDQAINSLSSFKSLPHRLEDIGEFSGIRFINDSISTVPESTIAAVKAFRNIDTLLLGGYDRGLDYTELIEFLEISTINTLIFLGKAGDRMFEKFDSNTTKRLIKVNSIESAFSIVVEKTAKGSICLLSPAAASYDQFHNFEHRGDTFKDLAYRL
mgnify:CR=1 FL=1